MSEEEVTDVIRRLDHSLFKNSSYTAYPTNCKASTLLANEVSTATLLEPKYYGITFNPDPLKHFNNRQYTKYCHNDQIRMLTRIEQSVRRNNPSIELIQLNFEIAPTLSQIHFHAMYKMPRMYVTTLENHYRKYANNRLMKNGKTWPYLKLELIRDEKAWKKYIKKEEGMLKYYPLNVVE